MFDDAATQLREGLTGYTKYHAMHDTRSCFSGEDPFWLAFAGPWGIDAAAISVPVLLVQGGEDRVVPPSHADALMRAIPTSELWLRPRDGHLSVLDACPVGMDWLRNLA